MISDLTVVIIIYVQRKVLCDIRTIMMQTDAISLRRYPTCPRATGRWIKATRLNTR